MAALEHAFWKEILFEWPGPDHFARVTIRLFLAVVFATAIGWEREEHHKTAGLRTHQLVALGSALFVISSGEFSHYSPDITRVVQGIATGIGFIGGGAILKYPERDRIRGLTTAGSIWCAAAVGAAAGLGEMGGAMAGMILALIVLVVLEGLKKRIDHKKSGSQPTVQAPG